MSTAAAAVIQEEEEDDIMSPAPAIAKKKAAAAARPQVSCLLSTLHYFCKAPSKLPPLCSPQLPPSAWTEGFILVIILSCR
jgi:hypothetical protein